MDKKVSELLEAIELNDEDILMILQSGQNKKIKAINALKKINGSLSNLETAINDIKPKMKDTGWKNFSWTNSDYIGTSQSSFTLNKWRVKDDILYVMVGVGSPNTIDSSNETEIARIPIVGNASFDTSKERIWTMGVGSAGSYGGFYIMQESSYISVYMKPHKVTNGQATNWFSAHFSVPLDETYVINE